CLGPVYRETDVNLTDRSNFKYRLLLGRLYLSGHFLVDPASTYLLKPTCKSHFTP
ncbi:MAG: RimK/LysX family protein, partial [Nitrospirales bacterium]